MRLILRSRQVIPSPRCTGHPVRVRIDSSSMTTATFAHYTANPQAAKAESLRQAMLKVMAMPQYSHPTYWAPYALLGDG